MNQTDISLYCFKGAVPHLLILVIFLVDLRLRGMTGG